MKQEVLNNASLIPENCQTIHSKLCVIYASILRNAVTNSVEYINTKVCFIRKRLERQVDGSLKFEVSSTHCTSLASLTDRRYQYACLL
jgi:hypothetical protein